MAPVASRVKPCMTGIRPETADLRRRVTEQRGIERGTRAAGRVLNSRAGLIPPDHRRPRRSSDQAPRPRDVSLSRLPLAQATPCHPIISPRSPVAGRRRALPLLPGRNPRRGWAARTQGAPNLLGWRTTMAAASLQRMVSRHARLTAAEAPDASSPGARRGFGRRGPIISTVTSRSPLPITAGPGGRGRLPRLRLPGLDPAGAPASAGRPRRWRPYLRSRPSGWLLLGWPASRPGRWHTRRPGRPCG